MEPEPRLEKNYVIALILCMSVLLGYPYLLKKFMPAQPQAQELAETDIGSPRGAAPAPAAEAAPAELPAPAPAQTEAERVLFENEIYEAEFSTLGGTITRLAYKGDPEREEETAALLYEAAEGGEGIFGTRLLHDSIDLTKSVFKLTRQGSSGEIFIFEYEKAGDYKVQKKFLLSRGEPIISLDVTFQNLASRDRTFAPEITAGIEDATTDNRQLHEFQAVAKSEKIVSADFNKVKKKGFYQSEAISWAGMVKKYFALLIKPSWDILSFEAKTGSEGALMGALKLEPLTAAPGESITKPFFIFAGPQRYETLKKFDVGFEEILSKGLLGELKILLLRALKLSHGFTHNFGWDIILLTCIIKLLLSPLTHMSYKSMEKMKVVQPKLKALQEKHKGDPSKLNKEMMELYKKHRVNPMGGCLPMLLQIPIFIAFYQVLNETVELRGAPFIAWIHDLSEPDRLIIFPFSIPLIGDAFNFLPLLMIISMVVQQRLTPATATTPEQQKIFNLMPIIFGFIFYKMPSGLVLYWFVNNILSIFQQLFVRRIVKVIHHEHE